ncbi:MAG TPA: ATP-binding cassette domain-containing protein [Bryobacteraceae bacterium]|nr:ATP-binding cassette domain-containing protein [Bryobacteraceae bacterium]
MTVDRQLGGAGATALADPPETDAPDRVVIRTRDLRKNYGPIEAVRGIDLQIHQGEIFGLIGPDGAGKTTTFQILAGIMEATSGAVEVFGKPARESRSAVGYLTQTFSLYPDLSVAENIRYVGDLRRVPPKEIAARGDRYLRLFDMDRFKDRLAGQLSGGMKQKLSLVCALVAQPRVLLLDEPTTGVDPVSRREFWDALAHLAADGLTIVVATPYLDEAERCNRVALMHLGLIHQTGTPAELRESLGMRRLEVHTAKLAEAEDKLTEAEGAVIGDVQRFGDRLDVLVKDPAAGRAAVEAVLAKAGIAAPNIRVADPTLENTFVAQLRAMGQELHAPPFLGKHPHRDLKGQIAIGAENLTKRFGAFTAVHNVNLNVCYGEVYGLLGANGAGKTTTIKMLCGLLDPTTGTPQLAGKQGAIRSEEVRERVGYMSQKFSLYDDLSIDENLDFFAGVYGVPENEIADKKKWVLEFSGLAGKEHQLTGSLPGGWKQRVAFGAATMHEPSVLFLDEPTSGVDPLARRAFWRMINRLADMGTAILVTTHYLEEAEQCNRLGFMAGGELVAEGAPSAIKARQGGHLLELRVDQPQRAADKLKEQMERWRVSLFGDRLHVITDADVASAEKDLAGRLRDAGVAVRDMHEESFSLEDVFIAVVEKARQEGKFAAED